MSTGCPNCRITWRFAFIGQASTAPSGHAAECRAAVGTTAAVPVIHTAARGYDALAQPLLKLSQHPCVGVNWERLQAPSSGLHGLNHGDGI
jgi:hypothetical protein